MCDTRKTIGKKTRRKERKSKRGRERGREEGRKYQPRFFSNIVLKTASMITTYNAKRHLGRDMTPTIWSMIDLVEKRLYYAKKTLSSERDC